MCLISLGEIPDYGTFGMEPDLEDVWLCSSRIERASYLPAAWKCADADQRLAFVIANQDALGEVVDRMLALRGRPLPAESPSPPSRHERLQRLAMAKGLNTLVANAPALANAVENLLREMGLPKGFKRRLAPPDRPPAAGWYRYREPGKRGRPPKRILGY
jgi:hypothetical protein